MPTISLNHAVMRRIQELNGAIHDSKILTDLLPNLGCPVESNNEEEIEIEVFPWNNWHLVIRQSCCLRRTNGRPTDFDWFVNGRMAHFIDSVKEAGANKGPYRNCVCSRFY